MLLSINNLTAGVADDAESGIILDQFSLAIEAGSVHAIMGPNGSGKSTLSKVITGDPTYSVESGSVMLEDKELLSLDPDERAIAGLFLAFQYPVEIPGVNNADFLRQALNNRRKYAGQSELDPMEFNDYIQAALDVIKMRPDFIARDLNAGFSGGEKKRNEILQLLVLQPKVAILDETDSGLDIDALRIVSAGVNQFKAKDKAIVMITHYKRLLEYIKPDYIHIMYKGQIIHTGDSSLVDVLEKSGYDDIIAQYDKRETISV